MNSFVIAVGNPNVIKTVAGDLLYTEDGDTFMLSVPVKDQHSIVKNLQKNGISAHTQADYQKIVSTQMKFVPLKQYDTATAFDWQKTGKEYFGMVYSNEFEVCSIDKRNISIVNKVEPVVNAYFSGSGAVIGFVRKNMVSFHCNEGLDKIFDIKVETSSILEVMFGGDDRFVAVKFVDHVDLYDILLGKLLHSSSGSVCLFSTAVVYFQEESYAIDKLACEPYDKPTKVAADKNKTGMFMDGALQKIVFINSSSTRAKNHSNIREVAFYFSESKMYAFITKMVNKKEQYFLESYSDKDVTINTLDYPPYSISVEDNSFIICDSRNNLTFYQKEKYNYTPIKTINKQGPAIVSMKGAVACVFDSSSQTIEFYDRLVLRSVYAHHGCTSIAWSQSGLYVAVFSNEESPTSLVQIFNNNGKLMHRKTYSKFTAFQWRPFIQLTLEEQAGMEPFCEGAGEDSLSDEGVDVSTLLSEWRGYLLAKIQSRTASCGLL